eukprot:gnl/TRDRNA2_/TRDRNA2_126518_c0_seq1.p1 gnl/TRDRNA2_/TRDRNA2_126518_c0~~gnl/TRDRNA2_/TRDRNA2_126518_c0_seq1.p1  ORF type:complete len:151 (-),score=19.82 gnl/TRDRNA2_/TRDRNA2_126518_c0_seq1:74-526(-)
MPSHDQLASRFRGNMSHFQTNYSILFVVQLVVAILFEPSALLCVVCIVAVWAMFLKKNNDLPLIQLGGIDFGPQLRLLVLAAATVVVLLIVAGEAMVNAVFLYVGFVGLHSVFHEVSSIPVDSRPSPGDNAGVIRPPGPEWTNGSSDVPL